ncbi:MAG TPA: pentapeptide repeat-containing protein [Micromonosporaceae bacterium]|nr:pentapeptide repeat-containing protein [Micromonosporaceae bacterium]
MQTRTIGDLTILMPELDPRDLDPLDAPPVDGLLEALVDGADWSGLELHSARLRLSHLVRVNAAQTTWHRASLYGCRFEQVDLSGARFTEATIERCEFIGCRLTGLQLTDTTLKNVIFEDCRLDYATLTNMRCTGPAALLRSNLDHATIARCTLGQAVIRDCQLADAELADSDLRGSDLRGTDLSTVIGISNLRGSVISAQQIGELAATLPRELALTVRDPVQEPA